MRKTNLNVPPLSMHPTRHHHHPGPVRGVGGCPAGCEHGPEWHPWGLREGGAVEDVGAVVCEEDDVVLDEGGAGGVVVAALGEIGALG